MPGLNAIVDVLSLRSALAALGRVAPNRFLSHALLSVDEHDSATLSVAVSGARLRVPVAFTRALTPGSVMIPLDRVPSILKLTKGLTVDVQAIDGPIVRLRTIEPRSGLSATYNLATVDVAPEESTGPVFAPDASLWVIPADELLMALERVKHAIGSDPRYSLDGALIEVPSYGRAMALVATDARRLARQTFTGSLCGSGVLPFGPESGGELYRPILPESAFKALAGLLKSQGTADVGLSFAEAPNTGPVAEAGLDPEPTRWARFTFGDAGGAELIARLGDGRFPRWEQVRPDERNLDSSAQVKPTDLARAVSAARVGTSDDAPGIRLEGIGSSASGALRLSAGETTAEVYADSVRGKFGITLNARYVQDIVKALGKTAETLVVRGTASLDESGGAIAATLETTDGFTSFLMPIVPPKPKAAPDPTAEEIQAEKMSSAWPLDLQPGDSAVWTSDDKQLADVWVISHAHPTGPGVYVARRQYDWGLGGEAPIHPVGPNWTRLATPSDPAPEAPSDPTPEPLPVKPTAKRILAMPYGTADRAADLWYARFLGWMKRRPEGSDHSDSLGDRVRRKLLLGDTFYLANRRYWDAFDASAAESESAAQVAPEVDPEPIASPAPESAAIDPAPLVGNPALQAILDTPVPRPRRADLRREPRKVWAREVRALLKSLGLSGISVRAPRYSQASSIDVTIPGQVAHDTSPMRGHDFAECPLCQQVAQAERHIERLIVGAFPDLDDRSDYQSDHFDAPLSIHTGSPIPVASDPAPEPEPLPVAPEADDPSRYLPSDGDEDDARETFPATPDPTADPGPRIPIPARKLPPLSRPDRPDPTPDPEADDESIIVVEELPSFVGMVKLAADEPHRLRACDVDRVMLAAVDAFDLPTFRRFAAWLVTIDLSDSTRAAVRTWATDADPEPEPIPVASVRGIPITFGRSVPRVAPVPMERTRHGIVLREPEPIGHPCNVTVADAGAPAIGLASSLVSCHGHTEPLSVQATGSVPSDPLGVLLAIQELSEDAPLGDPDPVPEMESDPAPEPIRSPRRVAPGLTLAESIDSEADRLEARRTGAGRLMATALRELAESVRWSGATTPDEHEARMALWDEWAIDNEPQESMVGY